jgi:hypothetical protein
MKKKNRSDESAGVGLCPHRPADPIFTCDDCDKAIRRRADKVMREIVGPASDV